MNAHAHEFHPVLRSHVVLPDQPATGLRTGDIVEFTLDCGDAIWRGEIIRIVGRYAKIECVDNYNNVHRFSAETDVLRLIRRADA